MSSEPSHEPAAAGTPHPAPGLPTVHDEAADTPMWIPILGVTLFLLFGGWAIVQIATHDSAATDTSDGGLADGEVADGATSDAGAAPTPAH